MGGAWIHGSPGSLGFPLSTGFLGVAASIALPCSAPLGDRFQSEGRARTSGCASTSCIRWTLSGVDSLAVEATPPLGPSPLGWTFLRWAGLHGLEGCDCLAGQDQGRHLHRVALSVAVCIHMPRSLCGFCQCSRISPVGSQGPSLAPGPSCALDGCLVLVAFWVH